MADGAPLRPQPESSDRELVIALREERSVMAFEILMQRYQRPLFGFILRQVGDRGHAEDLFQQTFLRVYDQVGTCSNPELFKPWAFGIAANLCRNEARRQEVRHGEQPLDDPSRLDGHPDHAQGPESLAMASETRERIRQALLSLHPAQREVFILYHFTRLSYEEIAEALAVPVGTVKSRMNGALSQLRSLLATLEER
jgi:RNA polymerase sigma-70 factor, ECF subfamily